MKENTKTRLLRLAAAMLLVVMLFTACASGAQNAVNQLELGRKYLTEMNYSEAIAAFTEAIRLNPDNIEAYLGRAEAYAAMGEYEKALADYDIVIEKTGDDPYTQAQAYAGRAGVDELANRSEDAESDYAAALIQLNKDTDQKDTDVVLTLKKDVLTKHAAVCITLALLEKAGDDYNALEQLGENVTAKRNELADLMEKLSKEDLDAENGLLPDTPDSNAPEDADTSMDTESDTATEESASGKEEQSASSKQEEAASSKEEQPASSKQEETAESKEEQPASSQRMAQKETYQVKEGWSSATVTYQVGTNTVHVRRQYEIYANSVWEDIYTFSQPLISAEHPNEGSTVFHVPAGTTVTCKWSYTGPDEDFVDNEWEWGTVSSVSAVKSGGTVLDGISGTSMTVQSGTVYALTGAEVGDSIPFPAIGFTAD